MRVVEQLIQHFWERGRLNRTEAEYLVTHGFIRPRELDNYLDDEPLEPTPTYNPDPPPAPEPEPDLEDQLPERRAGGKKKGGKPKPKAPGQDRLRVEEVLSQHLTERLPFPALLAVGQSVRSCKTEAEAAKVLASQSPEDLEPILVRHLQRRPQTLGELWFWFQVDGLHAWTRLSANRGPLTTALAQLLRADVLTQVGRLEQLRKAEGVNTLIDLLAARKVFLGTLRRLQDGQFPRLARWLVPPKAPANEVWPALVWSLILVYNATTNQPEGQSCPSNRIPLSTDQLKLAWETAWRMASTRVLNLLNGTAVDREDTEVRGWQQLVSTLVIPPNWPA